MVKNVADTNEPDLVQDMMADLASHGDLDERGLIFKYLLQKSMTVDTMVQGGFNPAIAYACPWTPLMMAISQWNLNLVILLLKHPPYTS